MMEMRSPSPISSHFRRICTSGTFFSVIMYPAPTVLDASEFHTSTGNQNCRDLELGTMISSESRVVVFPACCSRIQQLPQRRSTLALVHSGKVSYDALGPILRCHQQCFAETSFHLVDLANW